MNSSKPALGVAMIGNVELLMRLPNMMECRYQKHTVVSPLFSDRYECASGSLYKYGNSALTATVFCPSAPFTTTLIFG